MRLDKPPVEPGKRAPHLFSGYHFEVYHRPQWGYWEYFVLKDGKSVTSGRYNETEAEAIEKAKAEIALREAADEKKVRR